MILKMRSRSTNPIGPKACPNDACKFEVPPFLTRQITFVTSCLLLYKRVRYGENYFCVQKATFQNGGKAILIQFSPFECAPIPNK